MKSIERKSITRKFTILGQDDSIICPRCGYTIMSNSGEVDIYVTVGLDKDNKPIELFLTIGKPGETVRGFADAWAMMFSEALKHGAPLEHLVSMCIGMQFSPNGYIKGGGIVQSIIDCICKWLYERFLSEKEEVENEIKLLQA